MGEATSRKQDDWVKNSRSFALAWGLPTAALIGAAFVASPARTIVWALALVWMGGACLANATRCGRMHCYFTGPFFLLMAVATLLHGFQVVWLGPNGWILLGVVILAGGYGALWYVPERLWGKYREAKNPGHGPG